VARRAPAAHLDRVSTRATVDVFRFDDYRSFLRAYYERRSTQKRGLSLRGFSRRVGLRSPNYLKLVMDGERNLSSALAVRFGEACGLTGEALDYFCALVAHDQAKSASERALHHARLRGFKRYRETHKLAAAQASYHAHWYVPAIRELAARADFRDEPRWIARTLWPSITSAQAKRAIAALLELGLLARDQDGRIRQAEPLVETPDGALGHHVVDFHREMMRLASEALERVPREQREIASLTLCLSPARALELKAEIQQLERQWLQRYGSEDAVQVVQLNVQLFPLSRGKE
jgi:uncharacterized protein (TIGR02147 family)